MSLPRLFAAMALLAVSPVEAVGSAPREGGEIILTENEVDRSGAAAKWTKAAVGDAVKWQEQVRTGSPAGRSPLRRA